MACQLYILLFLCYIAGVPYIRIVGPLARLRHDETASYGVPTADGHGTAERHAAGQHSGDHVADGHPSDGHDDTMATLHDVQASLLQVVSDLMRLDQRLSQLVATIPGPRFEPHTDRPLNTAAEVVALVAATQQDEIESAIAALRHAAKIQRETTQPETAQPHPASLSSSRS